MSSVVISGDTSGAITLSAPAVAGTNTITLPAATGTVQVSGNMPAFSAYLNGNQTITSNVATKVALNSEIFDTANAFDSATNYRFTPQVAGYYQINGGVNAASSSVATRVFSMIYKNGSQYIQGSDASPVTGGTCSNASAVIYLNGSTDYVELYAFITASTASLYGATSAYNYFSGALIRAA